MVASFAGLNAVAAWRLTQSWLTNLVTSSLRRWLAAACHNHSRSYAREYGVIWLFSGLEGDMWVHFVCAAGLQLAMCCSSIRRLTSMACCRRGTWRACGLVSTWLWYVLSRCHSVWAMCTDSVLFVFCFVRTSVVGHGEEPRSRRLLQLGQRTLLSGYGIAVDRWLDACVVTFCS